MYRRSDAALFAFPATALAIDDARAPDQRTYEEIPSHLATIGTDVAAADQQASKLSPLSVDAALGTDVAAADQQASKPASSRNSVDAALHADNAPVESSASSGSEFDWADAGAGAAGAAIVIALSVGGVMALRRRERRPPSALAG